MLVNDDKQEDRFTKENFGAKFKSRSNPEKRIGFFGKRKILDDTCITTSPINWQRNVWY